MSVDPTLFAPPVVIIIQNNSIDPSFIVDTRAPAAACLIHLLILIGEKLVDRHFVTSYYLHNYEEVVHWSSNIFLVPFGKLCA